jgi:hypothetical protein
MFAQLAVTRTDGTHSLAHNNSMGAICNTFRKNGLSLLGTSLVISRQSPDEIVKAACAFVCRQTDRSVHRVQWLQLPCLGLLEARITQDCCSSRRNSESLSFIFRCLNRIRAVRPAPNDSSSSLYQLCATKHVPKEHLSLARPQRNLDTHCEYFNAA